MVVDRGRTRFGRVRRLAWNNDGSDITGPAYGRGSWSTPVTSPEQFVDSCMRFLEGTAVDSIFYCGHVNEPDWEHPTHNIPGLAPHLVRHVVDFAHRNRMDVFYSIRMNDRHACIYPPNESYWPRFRLEHPELLLGGIGRADWEARFLPFIRAYLEIDAERRRRGVAYDHRQTTELERRAHADHPLADVFRRQGHHSRDFRTWATYDYAHPEVRSRYLAIVDGACERYDLDGVELDWLRAPILFRAGEERANIPLLTDFVRRVRRILDRHGERRGRRPLLAMRTPDTIELGLANGMDFEAWARDGLLDLLMAGTGLMPFTASMDEWVELGRRHDIPVYGFLDRIHPILRSGRPTFDHRDAPLADADAHDHATHAATQRLWDAGVDGIYLYDWFTHHGPTNPADRGRLPAVHDPTAVWLSDKLYAVDRQIGHNSAGPACVPGQLPRPLAASAGAASATLSLPIADVPAAARAAALLVKWGTAPEEAAWRINGVALAEGRPHLVRRYGAQYGQGFADEPGWTRFDVPPGALRKGANAIEVAVRPAPGDDADATVTLEQVWVSLRQV